MHSSNLQTYIDLNAYIWLKDETIFPNAKSIIPERWSRDDKQSSQSIHPYILNPFSVGTRMCAGLSIVFHDNHN